MEVNAGRSKDCMKPQIPPASSGWVETWRLNMNYAIGLATRYSTGRFARGTVLSCESRWYFLASCLSSI